MVTPCTNNIEHFFITNWPYTTCLTQYTLTQCTIHTPYRSQYAAITLTTPCTPFTYLLLTKRVTFSQALTLVSWRWFLCKPKHVGKFLLILECFNNSTFLTLCASVGNKKVFNIIDARCNHEVKYECIFTYIYYFNLCTMHLVQFIIQTKNAQYIYIYIYISINNILYTYRKRSYMFHWF